MGIADRFEQLSLFDLPQSEPDPEPDQVEHVVDEPTQTPDFQNEATVYHYYESLLKSILHQELSVPLVTEEDARQAKKRIAKQVATQFGVTEQRVLKQLYFDDHDYPCSANLWYFWLGDIMYGAIIRVLKSQEVSK